MLDRSAKDNVCSAVDALRDDLTKLGLDLGNIEAPLGKELKAGNYVYDWMSRNGFRPERIGAYDDRFNVVGRVTGTGGGLSLSFNSHLDTIMSREDSARFIDANDRIYHEAWLEDGKIWGYPLVNCKGPMTCWLIAAKALQDAKVRLKGDIVLSAVCGELCGDLWMNFRDMITSATISGRASRSPMERSVISRLSPRRRISDRPGSRPASCL